MALGLLALAGCTSPNPYFDPTRAHHTPTGFRNNDIGTIGKSSDELLRWFQERWDVGDRDPTGAPTVAPDLAFIQRNARARHAMEPAVTWLGHATTLVQSDGLNVLTDPIFSDRASPVALVGPRRKQPPGLRIDELPPIDVVVVSHNHYDHLDRRSVLLLAAQASGSPLFLVPLGVKPWMASLGIDRVIELDWWQSHKVGKVEFHFTPVQHWSGRTLTDRHHTLWGGWAVMGPDLRWYFSGDTGYSSDFAATRARLVPKPGAPGFDLALIAIGAYEPNWFMKDQHVNPREAVRIHQDLGARRSIGVHWGTFDLSNEALSQPPRDLARERELAGLAPSDFDVMAVGETRRYPHRHQTDNKSLR